MVRGETVGGGRRAAGEPGVRLLRERLRRHPGHRRLCPARRQQPAVAGVGGHERLLPGPGQELVELLLQRHRPHHHH